VSPRRTWSLASPRVVFPALAGALALATLLRPADSREDSRLTSTSAAPNGAGALYDVAGRLGWRPERRLTAFDRALDSTTTYLVLAPVRPVTAVETHRLLDAVRGGAGLIVAVAEDEAMTESLTDSLRLAVQSLGFHALDGGAADRAEPQRSTAAVPVDTIAADDEDDEDDAEPTSASRSAAERDDPGTGCRTARGAGTEFVRRVFRVRKGGPLAVDTLLGARFGDQVRPAALETSLGRGRVVAIADPDLLRNDVLRLCGGVRSTQRPGVRAVRFLEAAAPDGGALVFDEWHQGYGRQPEEVGAVSYALGRTGWGRAVGIAVLAALLWLWAAGSRVLVPVDRERIERRSPLEHVGALARAYEQVGASRTAVRRLVRGLRRRHPSAARRGSDDAAFLDALASRQPALASAVALVRDGADRQLAPAELALVGAAVETIDAALTRPDLDAGTPRRPA
jgi:hypothetical protein